MLWTGQCELKVFTTPPVVSCSVSYTIITTLYDPWKKFIRESKLRLIAKIITDKVIRCKDVDFSLTLNELESFIAKQLFERVWEKPSGNFLMSKSYEFLFAVK